MSRFDYSKWDKIGDPEPSSDDLLSKMRALDASRPPSNDDLMNKLRSVQPTPTGSTGVDDNLLRKLKSLNPDERDRYSAELDRVATLVRQAEAAQQQRPPDASSISAGIRSQTEVLRKRLEEMDAQRAMFDQQQRRLEQLAAAGDGKSVMRFFQEQGLDHAALQRMMGGSQGDSEEVIKDAVTAQVQESLEDAAREDRALEFAQSMHVALAHDQASTRADDEEKEKAAETHAAAVPASPVALFPQHHQRIRVDADGRRSVVMAIELPELESAADVALDIAPRAFKLRAPVPVVDVDAPRRAYLLSSELEHTVDAEASRAKWSKRTRTLSVTLPVAV